MFDKIRRLAGRLRAAVVQFVREKPFWSAAIAVVAILVLDTLIGGPLWPLIFAGVGWLDALGQAYAPIMAFYTMLGWVAAIAVMVRLLILYANHSHVTGREFEIHEAFDKVRENPIALGIVLAGLILGVFDFAGRLAAGG